MFLSNKSTLTFSFEDKKFTTITKAYAKADYVTLAYAGQNIEHPTRLFTWVLKKDSQGKYNFSDTLAVTPKDGLQAVGIDLLTLVSNPPDPSSSSTRTISFEFNESKFKTVNDCYNKADYVSLCYESGNPDFPLRIATWECLKDEKGHYDFDKIEQSSGLTCTSHNLKTFLVRGGSNYVYKVHDSKTKKN